MHMPPPVRQKPEGPKNLREFLRVVKDSLRRLMYIYRLVWQARPSVIVALSLFALLNGVFPVVLTYISKLLLDTLVQAAAFPAQNWAGVVLGLLTASAAFSFGQNMVRFTSSLVSTLANESLVFSIRLKIMNKAKTLDLACFDLPDFYSKLENANREAGGRPLGVLSSTFSIVSSLISTVSFIVMLSVVMPWAPLVLIVVSLPGFVVSMRFRKKMVSYMRWHSKERRQMDYYNNLVTDKDLAKEVRLFSLAETFIGKFKTVFAKYYRGFKRLVVREWVFNLLFNLLVVGVILIIQLPLAFKILAGELQIGDFSLYSSAVNNIYYSVAQILALAIGIYEGTLFIDNMITFMEQEPKIVPSLAEPRPAGKNRPHTIEFRNVSFSYPSSAKKVLDGVNVTIRPGETAVLVGLNGAGKTTFLKLLTRLYDPTEGQILLDGYDIREYSVESLHSLFGIIFQDFGKFAFSVKENIAFGQIDKMPDMAEIQKAAQSSSADAFIAKLSDGYDTPLMRYFEEEGTELSVGQWQKLAVARAFYRDSDILILDEPTASLDAIAEQEIFDQFDRLRGNKTTVFVSHRLSSATMADHIIVLENGRVVEQGNHDALMAAGGKYAELFNVQASRYRSSGDGCSDVPLSSHGKPSFVRSEE